MISDKKAVQDLISLLHKHEVRDVVISPGSRNAPFILSFFGDPRFRTYSIADERVAAFFALGLSQQTQKPSVIICTSGTAALNFAPAIAEAYYQRVPMLVVTADRPVEWIDMGEGQSIRQRNVYSNYVKASFEIAQESGDADLEWFNRRQMDEALRISTATAPGPVHVNFPLRESLYGSAGNTTGVTPVRLAPVESALPESYLNTLRERIRTVERVLVLAGQLLPDETLNHALQAFSRLPQVAVLTETHSNIHGGGFIGTIDRLISGFTAEDNVSFHPQLLITIGSNIISRRIKALLRKSGIEHWHVDPAGFALDTYRQLSRVIPVKESSFFEAVNPGGGTSDYRQRMLQLHRQIGEQAAAFMMSAPFSDLKATAEVIRLLPADTDFHMGNSAAVRYVQLFDLPEGVRCYGNRGVSGIDGCTSTAIGSCVASGRHTVLLTGDVGFFYDTNAFWQNYTPAGLKVIVLNNQGGGIFRIIEGPSATPALDEFFETHHQRSAKGVAEMFGIAFRQATDFTETSAGLEWLFGTSGPAILEIMTPRTLNDQVLRDYFLHIATNQHRL